MTFIFLEKLRLRLTISRRRIVGLSLVFAFVDNFIPVFSINVVLVVLNQWPIVSWTPRGNLSSLKEWL